MLLKWTRNVHHLMTVSILQTGFTAENHYVTLTYFPHQIYWFPISKTFLTYRPWTSLLSGYFVIAVPSAI